jgi:hypothetical protein
MNDGQASTAPLARLPNLTAVRQWVAAVGLISHAEDLAKGATSVDRASALIVADTSIETALGLISSFASQPLTNNDYGTYLKRAHDRARLPSSVVQEISAVHKLRNSAVHQGADVGPGDAHRAIVAARNLLDVYVPRVLRSAKALRYGAGVADAVAGLLPGHPIGHRLGRASLALAQRDEQAALEHTAAALHLARIYAEPALPAYGDGALAVMRRATQRDDRDDLAWRQDVENWLVPMALGLTPSAYGALRRSMPAASYIPGSNEPGGKFDFRHSKEAPGPGTARQTLETVSQLALRLFLRDSLRYPSKAPGRSSP